MNDRIYQAQTTALVLIDVLNDFLADDGKLHASIAPMLDKTGFVAHVAQLLEGARAAGVKIIFAPHGTDALRFTFAALASPSRDLRFDLGRVAGYRNFCNKLWNAARFVTLSLPESAPGAGEACELSVADRWIRARFGRMLASVASAFAEYRFDYAASALYERLPDRNRMTLGFA